MHRIPFRTACLSFLCVALLALLAGPGTVRSAPKLPEAQKAATPLETVPMAPAATQVPQAPAEPATTPARAMIPPVILGDALNLAPYLDMLADPLSELDITSACLPENAALFRPFAARGGDAEETGAVWLRFTLAPSEEGPGSGPTYLIDLGSPVPGGPVLYSPTQGEDGSMEWRETTPGVRGILLLPEPRGRPLTCFLRMDNIPSRWFAPTLRTPQDAATSWSPLYRLAALFLLAILFVQCLLRGLAERGQWRFWALLYLAAVMVQAWLGITTLAAGYTVKAVLGVMTPGAALLLLPQVGRLLMRCDLHARRLDVLFILFCLPGAAAAALPLLPSFQWTTRYAELWPLGMVIFIPIALGAMLCGLAGSARFLLGCLIPPAATAAAVLGARSGFSPALLASLPVWGTALGALFIVGLSQPAAARSRDEEEGEDGARKGGNSSVPPSVPAGGLDLGGDGGLTINTSPADVPASEITPAPAPQGFQESLSVSLAPPMRSLARDLPQLAAIRDLPAQAREQMGGVLDAVETMARALSAHRAIAAPADPEPAIFQLKAVAYAAQDEAMNRATANGTSLPCAIDPSLASHYLGRGEELRAVLAGLLRDLVGPSRGGQLSLGVHRAPGTTQSETGADRVLFSVTRTGEGRAEPTALSLTRAQALARACEGAIAMQCREGASTVALTLPLVAQAAPVETPAPAPQAAPHAPEFGALLLADNPNIAVQLLGLLDTASCRARRAGSLDDLRALYEAKPAQLIVIQGRAASPAATATLAAIRENARANGLTGLTILAFTLDMGRPNCLALAKAGFTHALGLPVERASFLGTVEEAHENAAQDLAPKPEPAAPVPDLFGPAPMDMDTSPAAPAAAGQAEQPDTDQPASAPDEFAAMASSLRAVARTMREPATQTRVDVPAAAPGEPQEDPEAAADQPAAEPASVQPAPARPETTAQAPAAVPPTEECAGDVAFSPKHDTIQPDTFDMPALGEGPVRPLQEALSRAVAAYNGDRLAEVASNVRAVSAAASLRNMPAVARIASLIVQASESGDRDAVHDLLPELSMALERKIREIGVKP